MAKRKLLDPHAMVFSFVATQPITWASWHKAMGPDGSGQFLEAIHGQIGLILKLSQEDPISYMLNESTTMVGILEVLRELHPHRQLYCKIGLAVNPELITDTETVIELLERWNETTPGARLTYLCCCYNALYKGRPGLGPQSRKYIALDAVIGIASLFGIEVPR